MDTPHEEEPEPRPEETDSWAELDRSVRQYPGRMEALMKHFGGHPYDQNEVMPFKVGLLICWRWRCRGCNVF